MFSYELPTLFTDEKGKFARDMKLMFFIPSSSVGSKLLTQTDNIKGSKLVKPTYLDPSFDLSRPSPQNLEIYALFALNIAFGRACLVGIIGKIAGVGCTSIDAVTHYVFQCWGRLSG